MVSGLLKSLGQWNISSHERGTSGEPRTVPRVFIWPECVIKVCPALMNWASVYECKERHLQHLQQLRPRCACCDTLAQVKEVCCRELHSSVIILLSMGISFLNLDSLQQASFSALMRVSLRSLGYKYTDFSQWRWCKFILFSFYLVYATNTILYTLNYLPLVKFQDICCCWEFCRLWGECKTSSVCRERW